MENDQLFTSLVCHSLRFFARLQAQLRSTMDSANDASSDSKRVQALRGHPGGRKSTNRRSVRIATRRIVPAKEASSSESDEDVSMASADEAEEAHQESAEYTQLDEAIAALEPKRRYRRKKTPDAEAAEPIDKELRGLYEQCVEMQLRRTLGDEEFASAYPNRIVSSTAALSKPTGTAQPSAYQETLRKLEDNWNGINASWGVAPLLFADWTQLPPGDQELSRLRYTHGRSVSTDASALLAPLQQLNIHTRCEVDCRGCERPTGKSSSRIKCCSNTDMIEVVEDKIKFSKKGAAREPVQLRVECGPHCRCDPDRCGNRGMQHGRDRPVMLFRSADKGWVVAEQTVGEGSNYDFSLAEDVLRDDGSSRPLFLTSYKRGNECRYVSHSCQPNCFAESSVLQMQPLANNAVVFRASKRIRRGEELTIDYMNGDTIADGAPYQVFFDHCKCNAATCRFTESKVEEYKEEQMETERRVTLQSPSLHFTHSLTGRVDERVDRSVIELSSGEELDGEHTDEDIITID